jgi:hypothetical protein
MSGDRDQLETMVQALDASPRALHRPICRGWAGDYQISGKRGHILPDGDGFLLFVSGRSKQHWTHLKKALRFCRLTQDGDDEGCLHLERLPVPAEADAIRGALGIRRRRHLSEEELVRTRSTLERARALHKTAP